MDYKPDVSNIKQENREVIIDENNENYLDFVVRVKVESKVDWQSIQTVLERNKCQENISYTHKNYEELIQYDTNEKYQQHTKWQVKQEISPKVDYEVINNNEVYQDKISCKELKAQKYQFCLLCGKCFSNRYYLLQHNLKHLEVPLIKRKVFKCEHCPNYYTKKNSLKNHILINHYRTIVNCNDETLNTKQMRKCLICDKTFPYKTWYGHMKEVHCVRKFKCDKCDLSFKAQRYLNRHIMLVHERVQKYNTNNPHAVLKTKCPKCPAQLRSKYALTTHLRNCHSDEKFTCHLCESTLKCKSYLRTHLKRVHRNDGKVHRCEICGKEFKSQRYMQIHIRNYHWLSVSSKG